MADPIDPKRMGAMCNVTDRAWRDFCEGEGRDIKWDRPQPVISINDRNDRVMLAFPFHWWDPEDLEEA